MKWQEGHRSDDVEDRRGQGIGPGGGGFGGARLGVGGMILVGVLSLVFKRNLFVYFQGGGAPSSQTSSAGPRAGSPEEERLMSFVSFVFDDVQNVWAEWLPRSGQNYARARMVVFTDRVRSGCGVAESAMGPFYCPADRKVYVDLGFYGELQRRFGAPGDFAQAYVIAHEVGHHLQNLLGTERRVRAAQRRDPSQENALSVRMELQADCYAGVWAHSTQQRNLLERGDVDEGLAAASAVGDDRIQRQAGRAVNPESWTHGSARQRAAWFRKGFTTGDVNQCDTFSLPDP
ncbi:MAG: neutral zinc metallopeptidase [Polyangiales bacterium]